MTVRLFSHGNVITGEDRGYIAEYDLDARRGRGTIRVTDNPAEALVFEDVAQALRVWKTPSPKYPRRSSDGRPNRPLTALTVEIVPDGQEPTG
jgi:hypothetical protein